LPDAPNDRFVTPVLLIRSTIAYRSAHGADDKNDEGAVPRVVDLSGLRHTVEEINDAGLQRILGAHDEEPFSLN
jgi:hypothetical protein